MEYSALRDPYIRSGEWFLICHAYQQRSLAETSDLLDQIRRIKEIDDHEQVPALLVVLSLYVYLSEAEAGNKV